MTGRLILLCGLAGAGKTTLARQLEAEGAVRMCPDEWLVALGFDIYDKQARVAVEDLQWELAQTLALRGVTVVDECGVWQRSERDLRRTWARAHGVPVELRFLDAPVDVLTARVVERNRTLPAGAPRIDPVLVAFWDARIERPDAAELALFDRPTEASAAFAMSSGPTSRLIGMEPEHVTASTTIEAAQEAVFAVLADPRAHADIDGTGWVRASVDNERITAAGQVFRMGMYHENHPDKDYAMANRVEVFDEPRAIAWQPGQESETGELTFGGWIWRYDLEATDPSRTTVTLTYDWSAVPAHIREYIQFPPFGQDHLDNSLRHLADLAVSPPGGRPAAR